jgi:isochorismate hydrolase
MNLDNPELNEPITARLLILMESSTNCVNRLLDTNGVDADIVTGVIARCGVIEARSMLFLSCLHDSAMESAIADINLDHEMEAIAASEEFLKEVDDLLDEVSRG